MHVVPCVLEQAKQSQREMRKVNRDLGTDLRQLERKEKELVCFTRVRVNPLCVLFLFKEIEIKKLAKAGQKEACAVLAKQLVQLRKAKAKNMGMTANVTSVGAKTRYAEVTRQSSNASQSKSIIVHFQRYGQHEHDGHCNGQQHTGHEGRRQSDAHGEVRSNDA